MKKQHDQNCDLMEAASFGSMGNVCTCGADTVTEERAFAEWANQKKRDPNCQESFALMAWKASAERAQKENDNLRALVRRQLQWQKHRDSVGIAMSGSEYAWITDAEAALASNA